MDEIKRLVSVVILFISMIIMTITLSAQQNVEIDISNNWQFKPEGMASIPVDIPFFYVWKKQANERFYFGDVENGPWKIIEGVREATYTKIFNVPEALNGKKIFLHFEAVHFLADVYLNNQLIGSHLGGYVPFEFEITPFVEIASNETLRVEIKYNDSRFLDPSSTEEYDYCLCPIGFFGFYWHLGIIGDVSLIGKPSVYIEDVFIRTSVRNSTITMDVAVANIDSISHNIELSLNIDDSGVPVKNLGNHSLNIAAGDTGRITVSQDWSDPVYWSSYNPHLYHTVVQLYENSVLTHERTDRFGFREFWIEGIHFMLNGVRQNLRGDNIVIDSENRYIQYLVPDSSNWSAALDSMLDLNFNVIRFHQNPSPGWMIDLCDEKGMMVVAESASYAKPPYRSTTYVDNANRWMKDWIKRDRNHPSIVIWSAENEQRTVTRQLSTDQLKTFGETISQLDDTRPIFYEGDYDLSGYGDIFSYHYPYSFLDISWPATGIYDMAQFVHGSKPTSWGEFEWSRGVKIPRSTWVRRQAIKTRTARIINVADVRVYRVDWAWHPNPDFCAVEYGWAPSEEEVKFLQNTMNPVAVFDRNYYEFSPEPDLITYDEATIINRNLIIFNDEMSNTAVEVKWRILVDDLSVDEGSFSVNVELGEHIQRQLSVRVPYVPVNKEFQLELSSWKNSIEKFREAYPYISKNIGIGGPPSKITNLQIEQLDQKVKLSWSTEESNIKHYNIYKSTDIHFAAGLVEVINGITELSYIDSSNGITGNPDQNYFFAIKAVNTLGLSSVLSNIVGEFDFSISRHFNSIGLPLVIQSVTNASQLMGEIPGCTSVARWNSEYQGYEQYVPDIGFNNFTIDMGYPYYIHLAESTIVTFVGNITTPSFNLITTGSTNFNEIIVPLDKTDITTAAELCADISGCDCVAYWDAGTHGFLQYYTAIPLVNNFDVRVGYPYYVNVTSNVVWPSGGSPKRIVSQSKVIEKVNLPHLVWGELDDNKYHFIDHNLKFRACITERPEEILTEKSPGCFVKEDIWVVQCSSFPSMWDAGDILYVEIIDNNDVVLNSYEIELSYEPGDKAGDALSVQPDKHIPSGYSLEQNYPNPLNPFTTIEYQVPGLCRVKIEVYNTMGQKVISLLDEEKNAGYYSINWIGLNEYGIQVPSGLYTIRMESENYIQSRKMILLR
jgi:hypothetical protein